MSLNKNYKFGKNTFKTYSRPTGKGWEIGLVSGTKHFFVGNFVHEKDAKKWWSLFNKHIATFAKDYEFFASAPKDFYGEFVAAFLYKEYYNFLSNLFENYNSHYAKDYQKFNEKYEKISRIHAA